MRDIRESDWKRLRDLQPTLLDRFCSRVLAKIGQASAEPGATAHARYLKVYALIDDEDEELGRMFNDLRRSNAFGKLLLMRQAGLFTEDEWAGFSEHLRGAFERGWDF